jgi:(S)-ureidoglycine aminohydrolase
MDLFGTTRSRINRSHALITPESFLVVDLPGWQRSKGVILIAPRMGAQFVQYLAVMEAGGTAESAAIGVERMVYVLEGEVASQIPGEGEQISGAGGFLYCPPDVPVPIRAISASRLNVFEKPYVSRPGIDDPLPCSGNARDVPGEPFMGDPNAVLKTLLPCDPAFDMAVNLFTFQPGAALPLVEVHMMEHGLLMVGGQGIYRLDECWYPVKQGDVIWMAPFCPQWFVAMGTGPASYLYYKDVGRDPLEPGA